VDLVTKDELLENMRMSGSEFSRAAREVPEGRWSEGRYEEGWTAKDILAHVASIEWTYPKLFDVARGAGPDPGRAKERPSADLPGDYNQRHVDRRKDATVDELLEEFERNRDATIAAVQDADEDLLGVEVTTAGGIQGRAIEVLNYLTVIHVRDHLRDLEGGP
jgi:uncharacterized protein (TIGR03083 family)